jgi:hypothetical protein
MCHRLRIPDVAPFVCQIKEEAVPARSGANMKIQFRIPVSIKRQGHGELESRDQQENFLPPDQSLNTHDPYSRS